MVETAFNLFDAGVIGIIFLSTLLSFFRGFVRELLSLGSWIGAMAVTLLYAPDVANGIKDQVDKGDAAALLVSSAIVFFGAKIIFSMLNMLLMRYLKTGKDVGVLDNLMGLGFGFLRAALLISLSYYVYSFVAPEDNQPPWIAQSITKPYVASGAKMLEPVLDDFIQRISPAIEERAEQLQPGSVDQFKMLQESMEIQRQQQEGEQVDPQDLQRLLDNLQQQPDNEAVSAEEINRALERYQRQQDNLPR